MILRTLGYLALVASLSLIAGTELTAVWAAEHAAITATVPTVTAAPDSLCRRGAAPAATLYISGGMYSDITQMDNQPPLDVKSVVDVGSLGNGELCHAELVWHTNVKGMAHGDLPIIVDYSAFTSDDGKLYVEVKR